MFDDIFGGMFDFNGDVMYDGVKLSDVLEMNTEEY